LRIGDNYPTWDAPICSFGENYKITELQSAIAIEQLKKAPIIIARQKELFDYFMLKSEQSKFRFRKTISAAECIHISICILFDTYEETEVFIDYVNQYGVVFEKYCDKVLTLLHTFKSGKSWHSSGYPYKFAEYKVNTCEKTEKLVNCSAWMSLSPRLEEEDIDFIWDILHAF
jgi:8-amino-3,8-dideoxy-alpha-D-manno-octulosonate transaminase